MEDILIKLLILDGNETHYMNNKETYKLFKNLIIEVAKAEKNVRFCSNLNCSCHPEHSIKILLKNKLLVGFLNSWSEGIVEQLENWCQNYIPVVSSKINY